MTKRHFTNHELYTLRNDIPIDALIEKALCIPSRIAEGYFRFLCPLCKQFNTAVNPETNLARCFRCEENFNTIDLVIITRKLDFVESVRFLKNVSVSQRDNYLKAVTGDDSHNVSQVKHADRSENPNNGLVHIGNILGRVLSSKCERIPAKRPVNYRQKKTMSVQQNMINDRILKLEQKVDHILYQIEKIVRSINADNPSNQ